LSSLAALAAMTSVALAADIITDPLAGVAERPVPRAPFSWQGLGVGVLAGYALSEAEVGPVDRSGGAALGGAYFGYNFQVDGVVIGLEADVARTSFSERVGNATVEQVWQSTVRGRLGAAFDQFHVYGTGGIAVSRLDVTVNGTTDSVNQIGYALGAGIENHLGGRFTTRLEYLYTAYGDDGLSFTAPNDSAGFASHTLRAGLGLRF
ncbi:MAG: porin family protein, partial [Hyphomicrobiaceae bacterium]|nr:porin family protein [Hyphomicrobiaceae bacterium]